MFETMTTSEPSNLNEVFGPIHDIRCCLWIRTDKDTVWYTYDPKPTVISFHPAEWWDGMNVFQLKVKWMNLIETDDIIIVPDINQQVSILSKSKKILELPVYNQGRSNQILKSYIDDSIC